VASSSVDHPSRERPARGKRDVESLGADMFMSSYMVFDVYNKKVILGPESDLGSKLL